MRIPLALHVTAARVKSRLARFVKPHNTRAFAVGLGLLGLPLAPFAAVYSGANVFDVCLLTLLLSTTAVAFGIGYWAARRPRLTAIALSPLVALYVWFIVVPKARTGFVVDSPSAADELFRVRGEVDAAWSRLGRCPNFDEIVYETEDVIHHCCGSWYYLVKCEGLDPDCYSYVSTTRSWYAGEIRDCDDASQRRAR